MCNQVLIEILCIGDQLFYFVMSSILKIRTIMLTCVIAVTLSGGAVIGVFATGVICGVNVFGLTGRVITDPAYPADSTP